MARSTIKFLKQQGQFNARIAALVGCDRHTVARILTEPTDPPRRRCGIGSESCGIGSESGRCLRMDDYVRGPAAPREITAAAAC